MGKLIESAKKAPKIIVKQAEHPSPQKEASPKKTKKTDTYIQNNADQTTIHQSWVDKSDKEISLLAWNDIEKCIQKAIPSFTSARIADYLKSPELLPPIKDNVLIDFEILAVTALSLGKPQLAIDIINISRGRSKSPLKKTAGMITMAEAKRQVAENNDHHQVNAVAQEFRLSTASKVNGIMPFYMTAQPQKALRGSTEIKTKTLTPVSAYSYLRYKYYVKPIAENVSVYKKAAVLALKYFAEQPQRPPHTFHDISLNGIKGHPVHVAVWDSGTDISLFKDQLFSNPNEQLNGIDDDGNGIPDDIHGIINDPLDPEQNLLQQRTLYDPGKDIINTYTKHVTGFMDLQAGRMETKAAKETMKAIFSIKSREEQLNFTTNIGKAIEWVHGTHVTGIMLKGNPFVKLSVFRSLWPGESRIYNNRGPTDEELKAEFANIKSIAHYINDHDVKVMNISVSMYRASVRRAIIQSGEYKSTDEAESRTEIVHKARSRSFEHLFNQCPNTLFVVAAGNMNIDIEDSQVLPASIGGSNVIVVGAVDATGTWASFTGYHANKVNVYDIGVDVESVAPGGNPMNLSGTSMSSPHVANLASKIMALNPTLTPNQVKELIMLQSDPIQKPFWGVIPNQEKALKQTSQ